MVDKKKVVICAAARVPINRKICLMCRECCFAHVAQLCEFPHKRCGGNAKYSVTLLEAQFLIKFM